MEQDGQADEAGAGARTRGTLLGIYLNDHLATLTLAADLARRAASGGRAAALEVLAAELDQDRARLQEIMQALDLPVRQYKQVLARAAERVGRLKPNGHLLTRSPLSDLVEAEGLRVAVEANASCWRTMRELAAHEPRLDADRLEAMLARAQRQAEVLDDGRREAAAGAFAVGAAREDAGPDDPRPAQEQADERARQLKTRRAKPRVRPPAKTVPAARAAAEPAVPAHDELPLPDYDHLPTGSLADRIKPLDADGVGRLLAYERAHADRLPVTLILERRLKALAEGAQPTSGDVTAVRPEAAPAPAGAPAVSPATSGTPTNPPSHGVPTNPAQPR